jgi:hypothetical protein
MGIGLAFAAGLGRGDHIKPASGSTDPNHDSARLLSDDANACPHSGHACRLLSGAETALARVFGPSPTTKRVVAASGAAGVPPRVIPVWYGKFRNPDQDPSRRFWQNVVWRMKARR